MNEEESEEKSKKGSSQKSQPLQVLYSVDAPKEKILSSLIEHGFVFEIEREDLLYEIRIFV